MNRALPPEESPRQRPASAPTLDRQTIDNLLREARRLLANRAYYEVILKLEVHRPAEWVAVDGAGVSLVRLLGQAYLAQGDLRAARDCLEHVRALQQEQPRLTPDDHAAALSDLCKCYRGLQMPDLADECQREARRLLHG